MSKSFTGNFGSANSFIPPIVDNTVPPSHVVYRVKAHESGSHCVAFNPYGSKILSGGSDGILKLWNMHLSQVENKTLKVSNGPISSIAYNSIGTMIAAGDSES